MSSKMDGERLARLETKVENIEQGILLLNEKFDKFNDNLKQDYAAKWTEKAIIVVATTIFIFIINALMKLI